MQTQALQLVQLAQQATTAYGRADLTAHLDQIADRIGDPALRLLVVGEFKQGKSTLVNAMLNAPVCPVDDDVATSVPTVVRYAPEPRAAIRRQRDGTDADPTEETIGFDELPIYASELGNPANERRLHSVEVGLPRRLLSGGLTLVDTPGVGGFGSAHTAATMAALASADAALFVSDASQELTGPEMEFLRFAAGACPHLAFVLTKTDFYPDWEEIRELNRGHLERGDVTASIFPASATLRLKAIESEDRRLNLESGYPAITDWIGAIVADRGGSRTVAALAEVRGVVHQLRTTFAAERDVLADPQRGEEVVAAFNTAKEQADALRGQAARWQVTLNDGIADLTATIDHDLRSRMRNISREADATIEGEDPAVIWDEFTAWLKKQVSHDVAASFVALASQTNELSHVVAEHFADGNAPIRIDMDTRGVLQTAGSIETRTRVENTDPSVGGRSLTALRGSYGGLLMFGMVAQMAGLAMLNPATALVGVLMGRKAVKDEKQRLLTVRRQQAKITTRQFIDDASFAVGKQMKDALRAVQRELRDHYQARADELNRSIAESLSAAKSAVAAGETERTKRLRDVDAELQRLDGLDQRLASAIDEGGR